MLVLRADEIHRRLLARNATVVELARLSGLHYTSLYAALQGRPMTNRNALKVAMALDRLPELPLPKSLGQISEPTHRRRSKRNGAEAKAP